MNFFKGKLVNENGRYYILAEGAKIPVPDVKQKVLNNDKRQPRDVVMGIRPEHIRLAAEDAEYYLNAVVDVSEMMGSEVHLHVNTNDTDTIIRVPTTEVCYTSFFESGAGKNIKFTFDANLMHVFDAETEQNIFFS
jgi:multiple sugar transport system ATP-binding protein